MMLIFKGLVRAHTRRSKTGEVITVDAYHDKRTKKYREKATYAKRGVSRSREQLEKRHKMLVAKSMELRAEIAALHRGEGHARLAKGDTPQAAAKRLQTHLIAIQQEIFQTQRDAEHLEQRQTQKKEQASLREHRAKRREVRAKERAGAEGRRAEAQTPEARAKIRAEVKARAKERARAMAEKSEVSTAETKTAQQESGRQIALPDPTLTEAQLRESKPRTIAVDVPWHAASRSKMQKKGWKCWAKNLTSVNTPAKSGYDYDGDFLSAGQTHELTTGDVILHIDQSSENGIGVVMASPEGKGFISWQGATDSSTWAGALAKRSRELLSMTPAERIKHVAESIVDDDEVEKDDKEQAYYGYLAGKTVLQNIDDMPTTPDAPREGEQTLSVAGNTLVLRGGRWHRVTGDEKAEKVEKGGANPKVPTAKPGHDVTYTTAPEAYDGFGTQTMAVVGKDAKGNPIRQVQTPKEHSKWQRMRYGSGNHLSADADQYSEMEDLVNVEHPKHRDYKPPTAPEDDGVAADLKRAADQEKAQTAKADAIKALDDDALWGKAHDRGATASEVATANGEIRKRAEAKLPGVRMEDQREAFAHAVYDTPAGLQEYAQSLWDENRMRIDPKTLPTIGGGPKPGDIVVSSAGNQLILRDGRWHRLVEDKKKPSAPKTWASMGEKEREKVARGIGLQTEMSAGNVEFDIAPILDEILSHHSSKHIRSVNKEYEDWPVIVSLNLETGEFSVDGPPDLRYGERVVEKIQERIDAKIAEDLPGDDRNNPVTPPPPPPPTVPPAVVEAATKKAEAASTAKKEATAPEAAKRPATPAESIAIGVDPKNTYRMEHRIVDLADLITSHDPQSMAENPKYDQRFQNRLRDKQGSQMQIIQMSQGLVPAALLLDFHQIDRGSPIVGEDMMVESGNGRTMALMRAANMGLDSWNDYRNALRNHLEQAGLSAADLEGKKFPVMVRVRKGPMDVDTRRAFTDEANAPPGLGRTAAEKARSDADVIARAPELLANFSDSATSFEDQVMARKNEAFKNHFLASIPSNEVASLLTSSGGLNFDGMRRIKAAMFVHAFPGKKGLRLAEIFYEGIGSDIRNLDTAITGQLIRLAKAEAQLRADDRTSESLMPDIITAIDFIHTRKQADPSFNADEYFSNMNLGDIEGGPAELKSPLNSIQRDLAIAFARFGRSTTALGTVFDAYTQAVASMEAKGQMSMFGNMAKKGPETKEQLFALVNEAIVAQTSRLDEAAAERAEKKRAKARAPLIQEAQNEKA